MTLTGSSLGVARRIMAMLASSSFALAVDSNRCACGVAVVIPVLIDPMLVWSVGFWLSTGATAGVCVVAPLLAESMPGPAWLRRTIVGHAGRASSAWLCSAGWSSIASGHVIAGQLPAVPVAGFVMLFGIPADSAAVVRPVATSPDVSVHRRHAVGRDRGLIRCATSSHHPVGVPAGLGCSWGRASWRF